MTHEMDKRGATTALRDRIRSGGERHWTLDDLDWPSPAGLRELSRLVAAGELRRLRRGVYWHGRMTPFGMSLPPEIAAVRAIAGTIASGPAGASAAFELGLSTQAPAVLTVAAPRRLAPSRSSAYRFVSRAARIARSTAKLGATEVALLEVLETWNRDVELKPEHARAVIARLIANKAINLSRLTRGAVDEPAIVRARLRALLIALGHTDAAGRVPTPRSGHLVESATDLFGSAA